jgi:branched-chain amino acid aminotransferase
MPGWLSAVIVAWRFATDCWSPDFFARMESKIYIDGTLFSRENAKISVFDHGLLYGDGIFEGIRIYNGRIFKCEEHLARLSDSARAICMELPLTTEELTRDMIRCVRENNLRDGYIRLLVTRGVGDLGLNPTQCKKPTVIIIAAAISLYPAELYERGLSVVTCGTRRVSVAALNPAIKSLNYLNNVMAKIEALQAGAGEGLMLNDAGYVAECTGDNIFVLKNGMLFTPPISAGALRGITRGVVLDLAADLGIPASEPQLTRYDIYVADECFLTGTAAEIIPVVRLDDRPIGTGRPGPVTAKFIERYRDLTQRSGTPIYE